jgi:hypothetical protein
MGTLMIAATLCLAAIPALAQSVYVAGDVGVALARFGNQDDEGGDSTTSSESVSVRTSLASNWGVELGFTRDNVERFTASPRGVVFLLPGSFIGRAYPLPNSIASDVFEAKRQQSSIDAGAWVRQPIGDRVDLVYHAGASFLRERGDITEIITYGQRPGALPPTRIPIGYGITYGTRPFVGMESRISMGSHARLVPGLRVQGITDGWLFRPYVGVGWQF